MENRQSPEPAAVRQLAVIAVLLLAYGFTAVPVAGQVLRGEVVDAVSGAAVPGAIVTLTAPEDTTFRRQALTGADGTFALTGVPPGILEVTVQAYGFETDRQRVEFDGQPTYLNITVSPAPVATDGITASVERQRPHLKAMGFYKRARIGHGNFVTEEDIAKLPPASRASDVVRRVPSLKLVRGEPILRRGGSGLNHRNFSCVPNIWIDGVAARLITNIGPNSLKSFNNLLPSPESIRAIEVYPGGAGTPAQYGGSSSACGVILVWLKH